MIDSEYIVKIEVKAFSVIEQNRSINLDDKYVNDPGGMVTLLPDDSFLF